LYTIAGGKPIGKGGFGEVRLGTRKADGKPCVEDAAQWHQVLRALTPFPRPTPLHPCSVAVKILSKVKFTEEQDHTDMVTEVDMFARVRGHRNVVEMYDYFEDRAGFWIVCELCTGGELMERIVKSTAFSEKVAARYFKQMLEGLKWCHDHHVVHRDLK
jgi:serine/threonine protein kinase